MGVDKGCLTSTHMYAHSSIHSQASKPPQSCDPPHGPNQMAGAFSCNCRCGCIIDHDPELDWWRECRQCGRQVGAECCWSGDAEAMCRACAGNRATSRVCRSKQKAGDIAWPRLRTFWAALSCALLYEHAAKLKSYWGRRADHCISGLAQNARRPAGLSRWIRAEEGVFAQ